MLIRHFPFAICHSVMPVLPILTGADHPTLRKRTKKIEKVTKDILALLRSMEDTMSAADGVGIAAPQIGESLRVCIALLDGTPIPLINPEITWKSKEMIIDQEGCLSLPGILVDVPRPTGIVMEYLDTKGKRQERKFSDFQARIVQHEVDHLEGILIVDYAA